MAAAVASPTACQWHNNPDWRSSGPVPAVRFWFLAGHRSTDHQSGDLHSNRSSLSQRPSFATWHDAVWPAHQAAPKTTHANPYWAADQNHTPRRSDQDQKNRATAIAQSVRHGPWNTPPPIQPGDADPVSQSAQLRHNPWHPQWQP